MVDFESFFKDAGLLNSNGCGGSEANVNASNLGCMAAVIEPFWNLPDEIHVHVPMSLKQKIWRGEFINLAILLKGSVELANICSPNVFRVMANGTLEERPRECKEMVDSIENWTDAFGGGWGRGRARRLGEEVHRWGRKVRHTFSVCARCPVSLS